MPAGTGRGGALLVLLAALVGGDAPAENIDPENDGSQYAYAENVGWMNAKPFGDDGPGVQVGDSELCGWIWGQNTGWISLSCKNTLSCATTDYGVSNDGSGVLSGYAWAENLGWLSFSCANTASCGTASYGVTIDPSTGDFSGYAWSENAGWLSFNCTNTSSCGTVPYKVKSGWICDPLPAAPTDTPILAASKSNGDVLLSWSPIAGATGYDIVRGDLGDLRSTGGDFSVATLECLNDNRTTTTLLFSGTPSPGDGFWFLVAGANCGGRGTYGSGGAGQVGLRDGEIGGSGGDCP